MAAGDFIIPAVFIFDTLDFLCIVMETYVWIRCPSVVFKIKEKINMMKQVRNIIMTAVVACLMSVVVKAAAPAAAPAVVKATEFTITPKVSFDVGYVTRANHLGLQIQKNSAFSAVAVSLENSVLTPSVGATYFMGGEDADQVVLDGSLSKVLGTDSIKVVTTAGVQQRVIGGVTEDSFSAYAGFRLIKFPVLTVLATPYVTFAKDFNYDLSGVTVGLDRTISISSLNIDLTPRVEAYLYNKHTSYTAGSSLTYTGFKYVKPYIDASYVTSDTTLAARKFEGNLALVTGIKISF